MAYTYVHSAAAGRDLAGVALGQSPEKGVGQSVLAEVGDLVLISLEGKEVCYFPISEFDGHNQFELWRDARRNIREPVMASTENASMIAGS